MKTEDHSRIQDPKGSAKPKSSIYIYITVNHSVRAHGNPKVQKCLTTTLVIPKQITNVDQCGISNNKPSTWGW